MSSETSFYTRRCRHQEPQKDTCAAGVKVKALLEQYPKRRLPCFDFQASLPAALRMPEIPCDKLSKYTEEEAAKMIAETDAEIDTILSGVCPTCDGTLQRTETKRATTLYCPHCKKELMRGCRR